LTQYSLWHIVYVELYIRFILRRIGYTNGKKLGINEKNRGLLDLLNRFEKNLFSIKDASKIMGLSVKDTRLYLGYFARRGWLSRVKQGMYISVPLGTVSPQEYKENPWIVANRIFALCNIGGWSAAEHWEFTLKG